MKGPTARKKVIFITTFLLNDYIIVSALVVDLSEPQIIQSPMNTTTDFTTPVNLTCIARGRPAPNYEWYKDGILIPGEIRSFLYIAEPQPRDRGRYSCRVINNQGSTTSQQAQLIIPGSYLYSFGIF